MRVMVIVKANPESEAGALPSPEAIETMGAYNNELIAAGVMLDAGGLKASRNGPRVRIQSGKVDVMDGPFTETKELIGGYWVWQVASLQDAIDWAREGAERRRPALQPGDPPVLRAGGLRRCRLGRNHRPGAGLARRTGPKTAPKRPRPETGSGHADAAAPRGTAARERAVGRAPKSRPRPASIPRRPRSKAPALPKPIIISAQDAGSGTPVASGEKFTVPAKGSGGGFSRGSRDDQFLLAARWSRTDPVMPALGRPAGVGPIPAIHPVEGDAGEHQVVLGVAGGHRTSQHCRVGREKSKVSVKLSCPLFVPGPSRTPDSTCPWLDELPPR